MAAMGSTIKRTWKAWPNFKMENEMMKSVGFKKSWLRCVESRQSNSRTVSFKNRDSGTWNHVNLIQCPEIKKRCGDTATMLYCFVVLTKDCK